MRNCGAIILAAGKGTRMKSERPKVVFKLAGKEMIRRVTETALELDSNPIGIVVGYQKEQVIDAIQQSNTIRFIEQKEQLGTGHAVMVCEELFSRFDGELLILCGDIPLLSKETVQKLLFTHREKKAACTVLTIELNNPAAYGRIIRDENGRIKKIVEFKDASEKEREVKEINTGIYCFDSKLLFSALKQIDNDNRQQEYYLTDTLEVLNSMSETVIGMLTSNADEVTGINSQKELARLEMSCYRKINDYWLTNGVSIINPETVIIDDEVEIAEDVEIGAGSIIKGKTKIAEGAAIGPYCYLEDAVIGSKASLEGYNIIRKAEIPKNSRLSFQEKRIDE